MIELTEEQRKTIQDGGAVRVMDNGLEYVLVRSEVYDRLTDGECEGDGLTAEEMDRLREESVALLESDEKDA